MNSPKTTPAHRKAAEKWITPLLKELRDPALWALRLDLLALETPEANMYLDFVNREIDVRVITPAKPSRRSYEEITNENSSN